MSTGDVFNVSLTLLKLIGENMHKASKFLIAFRSANIIVFSVLLIFVTGPLFQEGHKNFAKIVEGLLAVAHPLLKYMLLIYNTPYVEELLADGSGGFWCTEYFDSDFIASEKRFYRTIRAVQLVLPISSTSAVLFFMLRPVFHRNRLFLVETWIVDSIVINTVVLAFQYYLFLLLVPLIMGYDSLYLALCVHIVVQIRRLKYKLENVPMDTSDNSQKRLIYCIKHHQFLIKAFLKMKNMFSFTLLFHYGVTLISCCIELYELMGNGDYDLEQVLNVFVLFCQFGYYAFPAEQVASEFGDLSNSLYMSQWYRTTPAFQKLALFLMAKSQVREQFSGGGIIPMNISTFGSVLRKSFSFYAVLRNVLNT